MNITRKPALWLAVLAMGITVALAACSSAVQGPGSGSGAPGLSVTSGSTASSSSYDLTGKTSSGATKITYSVDGGTTKTVTLSGASFSVTITLHPGANKITITVYDAAGDKTTKTISVTYPTGGLTITIKGLPSGVSGKVVVTGPSSFSKTVTSSTTLTGLAPDTYTLTPDMVDHSSFPYTAPKTQVTVKSGVTASVTIGYAASGGAAQFVFAFVSASLSFAPYQYGVTLSGPVTRHVTTGANLLTIPDLPAGTYTVKPDSWPTSSCSSFSKHVYKVIAVPSTLTITDLHVISDSVTYTDVPTPCI